MGISEREIAFKKEVQSVGGTVYTQLMLTRFFEHWVEPDRGRGKAQKMRFEKEKTWDTKKRLAKWARNNYDGIECFLSDAQKSIAEKRHAFSITLEEHLNSPKSRFFNNGKPKYSPAILNGFYAYWGMPENKPNPKQLRWEEQNFWNLETKLKQWAERSETNRF